MNNKVTFYDNTFPISERLPRKFFVDFQAISGALDKVRVLLNGTIPIGDTIDDNSFTDDGYRFHDVFHFSFATFLGWSPCSRALMQKKRKSQPEIDRVEDGARATITEEAISLMIFTEARKNNFFSEKVLSEATLQRIMDMVDGFEVGDKGPEDWNEAITQGYALFRQLINNQGGRVHFDLLGKVARYEKV